jgi:protein-tyrosine-phosphatase
MEQRYAEAVGLLVLIVAVIVVASYYRAFLFIVVPVILVAIFRFGIAGAAVAMLLVAFVGSVFISKGIGPPVLSQATPSERILALQIFLAATALWSFPVAAVLAERDCLLAGLDAANSRLQADNQKKSQMVTGLYRRLVNVEEQERLRLSHELHDQTGQTLAAALLERYAGERLEVRSAGTIPAEALIPSVVAAMAELGIDLTGERPKVLADEDVQASEVVVTMGCGDACPVYAGKHYVDWELPDPAGRSVEEVRPIRDEIDLRVRQLANELLKEPG